MCPEVLGSELASYICLCSADLCGKTLEKQRVFNILKALPLCLPAQEVLQKFLLVLILHSLILAGLSCLMVSSSWFVPLIDWLIIKSGNSDIPGELLKPPGLGWSYCGHLVWHLFKSSFGKLLVRATLCTGNLLHPSVEVISCHK